MNRYLSHMRWPRYGVGTAAELTRGDSALAVGLAVVELGQALVLSQQQGEPTLDAVGVLLILGQTLPLVWRRSHPVAVTVVTAAMLALFAITDNPQPLQLGPLVALAYLVSRLTPHVSVLLGAATIAGTLVVISLRDESQASDYYLGALLVGFAWLLGNSLRLRRAYLGELEDAQQRLEENGLEEPGARCRRSAGASPASCTTSSRTT